MYVLHSDKLLSLGKPSDCSENIQKNQAILYETNCGFFYEPLELPTDMCL